jgi:hypothetical protein
LTSWIICLHFETLSLLVSLIFNSLQISIHLSLEGSKLYFRTINIIVRGVLGSLGKVGGNWSGFSWSSGSSSIGGCCFGSWCLSLGWSSGLLGLGCGFSSWSLFSRWSFFSWCLLLRLIY